MKAGDKGLERTMPAQAGRFQAQDRGLLPATQTLQLWARGAGAGVQGRLDGCLGWRPSESVLCAVGEAEDGIPGMDRMDIQKMSFEATVKSKGVSKFWPNHPSYVATMIIFPAKSK